MLEMGIVVGLGLLVMFWKMNWRWRMKMLSNPLAIDIVIFIVLSFLHWGTFSGMMVAAVGALFCSIVLSFGRLMFGHVERGQYVPGIVNVRDQL
jgi:hypothetical protein